MTGKIYYLWSPSKNNIYIGSTKLDLEKRLTVHKTQAKKGHQTTSNDICEYGDAEIELIEEYEDITTEDLRIIENIYITNCDEAINKNRAHRTAEDKKIQKKEFNKKLNKEYKESGYFKTYYQTNKEQLKQKQKEYRKQKNEESRKNAHINKIKDMIENMNKLDKTIYDKRTLKKYNIKKNDDGFFSDLI
jgi:hypothetical protein